MKKLSIIITFKLLFPITVFALDAGVVSTAALQNICKSGDFLRIFYDVSLRNNSKRDYFVMSALVGRKNYLPRFFSSGEFCDSNNSCVQPIAAEYLYKMNSVALRAGGEVNFLVEVASFRQQDFLSNGRVSFKIFDNKKSVLFNLNKEVFLGGIFSNDEINDFSCEI